MGFTPKLMSDAFTHSWSLVKEEPCSNCGGIDPDGVYECEGCQQGFCQNCLDDGGLYGAAHDRYFDTRLPEIDMTRSKLANEYMSFQGDIESGANNMCRNCFEEYEKSESGAIKDAIGDARMERDDEIEAERNTVWPPVRSDEQMEDLRIQQQRNEAEMDLSERLFGDRKFQLKNASSDEPFESAWSVVKNED